MNIIEHILNWIEAHPQTTDLIKWIVLLFFAWISGFLSYLYRLNRKPFIKIYEGTSLCFLEKFDDYEGHKHAVRASLLLEISASNPSQDRIIINAFEAQIKTMLWKKRWCQSTSAIALPNRVRHQMGSGTKVLRNWFTQFNDGNDALLSLNGRVESKDATSGFVLFVIFSFETWDPRIVNNCIQVRVKASLASGEKLETEKNIPITTDKALIEKLVPGFLNQISHPTAWNVPLRS